MSNENEQIRYKVGVWRNDKLVYDVVANSREEAKSKAIELCEQNVKPSHYSCNKLVAVPRFAKDEDND